MRSNDDDDAFDDDLTRSRSYGDVTAAQRAI